MGCYDEVCFVTPCCNEPVLEQSKSGDCALAIYNSSSVPLDVVSGLDSHIYCPSCNKKYKIKKKKKVELKLKEVVDEY